MELLLASILAFVSTNIDDIFLLTLFFGNKSFKTREIVIGQMLGIGALICASIVISLIGLVIGEVYIGILGLVPVYIGIRGLIKLISKSNEEEKTDVESPTTNKSKIFSVAGVTIANGGDNIGIYVPLFATLAWLEKILMVSVFFAMTVVWCVLARYLAKHPLLAKPIDLYGHMVTPFVLIALGVYILCKWDFRAAGRYHGSTWPMIFTYVSDGS